MEIKSCLRVDVIDKGMDTWFMTSTNTLPLKFFLMDSKIVEEIEDDELRSPHELLEAPPLLFKPKSTSLKFGRKSHQPSDQSSKRKMKK